MPEGPLYWNKYAYLDGITSLHMYVHVLLRICVYVFICICACVQALLICKRAPCVSYLAGGDELVPEGPLYWNALLSTRADGGITLGEGRLTVRGVLKPTGLRLY